MPTRIADDVTYIAARMKEIAQQEGRATAVVRETRHQVKEAQHQCDRCEDKGFVFRIRLQRIVECRDCGNPKDNSSWNYSKDDVLHY